MEPSEYLGLRVQKEIRDAHEIPDDPASWTRDRYTDFCDRREGRLAVTLRDLLVSLGVP